MAPTAVLTKPTTETTTALAEDPFDVQVEVVTEIDAEQLPQACGTGDGCKSTCASSCASAV
ncbi:FxLD family lanthipeptide [Streptomyces sp. F63]|uniref:FxLD family lanthipeptide n=1 Tax=Streptomyces sp. F63 TaxID=2824887 RepID=UPI001B397B53|nr:FxLD family lanthipeptide [Streptomyces sp. F63]MBQ0984954.1 FxLD family lanthipeptide [Streptomyces sp. F63]